MKYRRTLDPREFQSSREAEQEQQLALQVYRGRWNLGLQLNSLGIHLSTAVTSTSAPCRCMHNIRGLMYLRNQDVVPVSALVLPLKQETTSAVTLEDCSHNPRCSQTAQKRGKHARAATIPAVAPPRPARGLGAHCGRLKRQLCPRSSFLCDALRLACVSLTGRTQVVPGLLPTSLVSQGGMTA